MANFARIVDGVAIDVSIDPENSFHPHIAAAFVAVPDDVAPGWRLIEGEWLAPEPPEEPDPVAIPRKVSPVEFKLLFTMEELEAIDAAKVGNANEPPDVKLRLFFEILDDPRLTFVDLGLQSTRDGLAYLMFRGLITEERRDQILTGELI